MTTDTNNNALVSELKLIVAQFHGKQQSRRMKRIWAERKSKEALAGRSVAKVKYANCEGRGDHLIAAHGDTLIDS